MRLLLPPETTVDAGRLLFARGARAFVDGLVSVVLPGYLLVLGFDGLQVGAVVTGTLLGSAALTLAVGLRGYRLPRRQLLQSVAVAMIATGVAFGTLRWFWALLVVATLGTLNPSSGDVSLFLPTEQALLPTTTTARRRTALYGRYSFVGFTLAAVGSLAAGVPDLLSRTTSLSRRDAFAGVFFVYAFAGLLALLAYRRLTVDFAAQEHGAAVALGPSRRLVYRLAALFSLDSFGGGFVVQSLLALWLFRRFGLSVASAGAIFFWSGLLSGASALLAVPIARRFGLVRTMVFTHLPANGLLVAAALMPSVGPAVVCLLLRSVVSQMDVPTRTSYVMAVVGPDERPAAAAITNVPRSLAAALPPLAAGWMLDHSTFGWPLIIAGVLKAVYDLMLLAAFRNVRPPEEQQVGGP